MFQSNKYQFEFLLLCAINLPRIRKGLIRTLHRLPDQPSQHQQDPIPPLLRLPAAAGEASGDGAAGGVPADGADVHGAVLRPAAVQRLPPHDVHLHDVRLHPSGDQARPLTQPRRTGQF